MKEHPDYKYRPRRKPKTLVKSPVPNHNQNKEQHLPPKYPFASSLELTLGIQPRPPTFSLAHYQLASPLDTTLAFDLQARLQQMYAGGLYPPWRYFGCPPPSTIPTESAPPSPPISYVCVKPPKTSPIQTQPPPSVI